MGIVIDIILIGIVLLSTFLGYKKGLVKLGAKLFAGIIAIILTIIIYKPVSGIIINNTKIDEKIRDTIIQNTTSAIEEKVDVPNEITNHVENNVLPEQAENLAKNIVYALTAVILFIVVKIVLSIVISLMDFVAKLPILKQFNEIGGVVYGLLRGALIAVIGILLLETYANMNPESDFGRQVQSTYIANTIYEKIVKK